MRPAITVLALHACSICSFIELIALYSESTHTSSRNKFVETALVYGLTYISSCSLESIVPASITILADSDYYSQPQNSSRETRDRGNRFLDFNVPLFDAHKTGLGSSAALVTALVSALLAFYLPGGNDNPLTDKDLARAHNLAQAAHCTAQGKIGSGFDVAAAVYGSCIYRRFSPAVLEGVGNAGTEGFSPRLRKTVDDVESNQIWDTQIQKHIVNMPKKLRLVMCDVDCGSETPSMVKKVFAWRSNNIEEALLLWETLQRGNDDLVSELQRLSETSEENFGNLRNIILTIRSLIREMSAKAGVPIEPKIQTDLLDACSQIPGVIGGVVPGAGGYDALALLVEDRDEVVGQLASFLETYQGEDDGDVGAKSLRLLKAKQEMKGICFEPSSTYDGWI